MDLSGNVSVAFAFGASSPYSFGSTSVRVSPTTSSRPRSATRLRPRTRPPGPPGSLTSVQRLFSDCGRARPSEGPGRSRRTDTTSSTLKSARRFARLRAFLGRRLLALEEDDEREEAEEDARQDEELLVDMRLAAPPHPDREPERDGGDRKEEKDEERDQPDVAPRERDGDLVGVLRRDRDERLALERPVRRRGQEQPVRRVRDSRVRRPVGVPEDDERGPSSFRRGPGARRRRRRAARTPPPRRGRPDP